MNIYFFNYSFWKLSGFQKRKQKLKLIIVFVFLNINNFIQKENKLNLCYKHTIQGQS